jgi:hypothetical protein
VVTFSFLERNAMGTYQITVKKSDPQDGDRWEWIVMSDDCVMATGDEHDRQEAIAAALATLTFIMDCETAVME